MLNSESSPTKPAAIAATRAFWPASSAEKPRSGRPIRRPPKISCNIGDAMPSTPMPADTLRQSTTQIIQKASVLCASFRSTWRVVIMALVVVEGVQPSGRQPAGGTR